jgi:hypothetical protein
MQDRNKGRRAPNTTLRRLGGMARGRPRGGGGGRGGGGWGWRWGATSARSLGREGTRMDSVSKSVSYPCTLAVKCQLQRVSVMHCHAHLRRRVGPLPCRTPRGKARPNGAGLAESQAMSAYVW